MRYVFRACSVLSVAVTVEHAGHVGKKDAVLVFLKADCVEQAGIGGVVCRSAYVRAAEIDTRKCEIEEELLTLYEIVM